MANLRLATDLWADVATTVTATTEASGFAAENVLQGPVNQTWRSTSDTSQYIGGDLGEAKSINFVSVLGHNLRTDQTLTIRLRLSNSSDMSSPTVDTTLDENDIIGADIDNGPYPAVINWWFTAVSSRYWRLNIAQASNDDGYIALGRVIVGSYWEPSINMDLGYRLNIRDGSTIGRTTGNILRVNTKPKTRTQIATLSHLTVTEEIALNKLVTGHEAFMSGYPETVSAYSELEQQHTVLGLLSSEIGVVRGAGELRQTRVSLVEGSTIGAGVYNGGGGSSSNQIWLQRSSNLSDIADGETALYNLTAYDELPRENLLDNPDFTVWQRGESFVTQTSNGLNTADRWKIGFTQAASETYTIYRYNNQETGDDAIGMTSALELSTSAAHGGVFLRQRMEEIFIDAVSEKTLYFSFWVYGGTTGITLDRVRLSVNLDNAGTGDSDNDFSGTNFVVASSTWSLFGGSVTMPSISATRGSNPNLLLELGCSSSQSAQLTGIRFALAKMEIGTRRSRFQLPAPAANLARCQRHYAFGNTTIKNPSYWNGDTTNTASYLAYTTFPVIMYSAPTVTLTNASATRFGSTPGTPSVGTNGFSETRTATSTGAVGSFYSSWTAATGW